MPCPPSILGETLLSHKTRSHTTPPFTPASLHESILTQHFYRSPHLAIQTLPHPLFPPHHPLDTRQPTSTQSLPLLPQSSTALQPKHQQRQTDPSLSSSLRLPLASFSVQPAWIYPRSHLPLFHTIQKQLNILKSLNLIQPLLVPSI
ncbi:hypothetical protein BLNAU_17082 [Blattamonas nauphoetae]|uniref:Uncharacterized protein n=1 Tax=Blattamonas nauphoetae TaxID=2049346 RepID=A0ABQ9X9M4_9EUKA|nr:hypothetical protein BLNAU_17082 [Blattamonas nauphoetae]